MILEYFLPVFKLVLKIVNSPEEYCNYEDCRETCINTLERSIGLIEQNGINQDALKCAKFAVISWIDETILRSQLSWIMKWQGGLLQRKYLNINTAGEQFFDILIELKTKSSQDPQDLHVKEVFLFCLEHGFCGKYSSPEDTHLLEGITIELRNSCLNFDWRVWPNEASITPLQVITSETKQKSMIPLMIFSIEIILLYLFLYILLYKCVL